MEYSNVSNDTLDKDQTLPMTHYKNDSVSTTYKDQDQTLLTTPYNDPYSDLSRTTTRPSTDALVGVNVLNADGTEYHPLLPTDRNLNEEEKAAFSKDEPPEFPEGGYGWAVVVSAGLFSFCTFEYFGCWGVFQGYYEEGPLRHTPSSSISWIGSIQYATLCFLGIFSGRLADAGWIRVPAFISTIAFVVVQMLIAEATQFWQFVLGQGLGLGIAGTFMFFPAATAVSHYFRRRIGVVQGIFMSFGSVGSIILPLILQHLLVAVGYKWAMRILGFIILFLTSIANLLLRSRLPPRKSHDSIFNLSAFKSATYSFYVAAIFIAFFGLNSLTFYIVSVAMKYGINLTDAFNLITFTNTGAVVGRVIAGQLCDYLGPINVLIIYGIAAAIITLVWPLCRTYGSLIAISIFYGWFSGGFEGIMAIPAIHMAKPSEVGQLIGMLLSVSAVAQLVGPPIAGAAIAANNGVWVLAGYSASMIILSCVLLSFSVYKGIGKWIGKY